MKIFGPSRKVVLTLTLLLLCVHPLLNFTLDGWSDLITDAFLIFWTLAAAAACFLHGLGQATMRRSWRLLTFAVLLWSAATLSSVWSQFVLHASGRSATIDDFIYFFYGVPLLLAIAVPKQNESTALFFWLDGLQSAALGYLAYVALFNVLPFSGAALNPISVERLVWVFDVENLILALLATARLWAASRHAPERGFLKLLCLFLWLYGLCAAFNNHFFSIYSISGSVDFVLDIPFAILFLAAALNPPAFRHDPEDVKQQTAGGMILDNARLVVLGLALILLAGWVARTRLNVATAVVFGAFIVYGIRSSVLQSRYMRTQSALEEARERLEQLVLLDALTGVANRRCFDQSLKQEWNRARRTGQPLSLLLIDVDHFKKLNDSHGHVAGDQSLIQLAQVLKSALGRPGDLLARYGGEEFAALLPDTGTAGAHKVAVNLQEALRKTPPIAGIPQQVTVSIGRSTSDGDPAIAQQSLVLSADRALYLAKQNGRNRIEHLPVQLQV